MAISVEAKHKTQNDDESRKRDLEFAFRSALICGCDVGGRIVNVNGCGRSLQRKSGMIRGGKGGGGEEERYIYILQRGLHVTPGLVILLVVEHRIQY